MSNVMVASQEAPQKPKTPQKLKRYEKPSVKTLNHLDVLRAVQKGSKFPARGYAG